MHMVTMNLENLMKHFLKILILHTKKVQLAMLVNISTKIMRIALKSNQKTHHKTANKPHKNLKEVIFRI